MNSIVIAIIIGVITAVFNKAQKEKGTSKPFSLNKTDFQDAYKKLKESAAPYRKGFSQSETPVSNQTTLVFQREEEGSSPLPNQIKKEIINVEKQKDPILTNINVEPNKLVDAVIWSEILGEPRARRPYFPRKSR